MEERVNQQSGILLSLAAFVVVVAGIKASVEIVVPMLLAVFIAVLCSPLMLWLRQRKVPVSLAVFVVIFLFVLVALTLGTVIAGSLQAFYSDLPEYEERLRLQAGQLIVWLQSMGVEIQQDVISQYFDPGAAMKMVAKVFSGLGNVLTNTFLILFTVIFILLEASGLPEKVKRALGDKTSALDHFQSFSDSVQQYLTIKTLVSMGTGLVAGIWLAVLGVDYAILWALIAFLFNYIPNIGSIIAAIPAMLVALIQIGPGTMALVALGYVLINTIFGNVVEPKFMGRSLGLSTLVVFVSLIFWGWVLGPVGMLLSIPLTMVVKIALETSERHKRLAIFLDH